LVSTSHFWLILIGGPKENPRILRGFSPILFMGVSPRKKGFGSLPPKGFFGENVLSSFSFLHRNQKPSGGQVGNNIILVKNTIPLLGETKNTRATLFTQQGGI